VLKLLVQAFHFLLQRAFSIVKLPLEGFHLFAEINASVSFVRHLAHVSMNLNFEFHEAKPAMCRYFAVDDRGTAF
jgi:hypothetical protein